jgi:hypothetical protein
MCPTAPLEGTDHRLGAGVSHGAVEAPDAQFDQPITYDDIPTTLADADRGATKTELASLITA